MTGKTRRGRTNAGCVLAVAASFVLAAAAMADPPKPATAPDVKAVLGTHCADCRARYEGGDGLDLAALADDPGLIVPKRPDASPAYQRLFAPLPKGEGEEKRAAPSPAEIEAVRDWIESLPARDEACRERAPITVEDTKALIRRWGELAGGTETSGTRFVSLAHLWNACVPLDRLMELRVATATLLGVLTQRREDLRLETLGEESALIAISPGEQALEASGWDALTADAPLLAYGAVPADWLAARVLARSENEAGAAANPAAYRVASTRFDGAAQRAVSALARSWTRDVDLTRAAAERAVTPRKLKAALAKADGDRLVPARRLAYGTLPREAWERLSSALDGASTKPDTPERETTSLDIVLWPDEPFYRPRDLAAFNVRVSKACHLTLISVDDAGQAIVLFPNELDADNLVAPGVAVKVPDPDAGYQFRFDKAGEETVVAVCQRHARRLEGIDVDYERQRFPILGDWRTFLRTAPDLEKDIRKRAEAEEARRKRRRRPPLEPEPPPVDAKGPPMEGRAAITITVDPGGRAPD